MQASSYQLVYLFVVTVLTIVYSSRYKATAISSWNANTESPHTTWIIAAILTLFIGFRPVNGYYFVDMANYYVFYYAFSYGKDFDFSWDKENFLFDNLFDLLGANYFDITFFFIIIAAIYFLGTAKALCRLFPNNSVYAFLAFLGAFSTFSYATNGIKAGAAATIFLCAIAYRDKKWIAALLLFASLGFHHSMTLPIVAYIAALFYKNTKAYLVFWIICMLMAAAHITFFQNLFADISNDESAVRYLTDTDVNWGGKTGFRWDFILYSALPIGVGYYSIFKQKVKSAQYTFTLNVYLLTNAVWMLCMYIPFNNRIAYLSWCLYPVVLVYPFLNCKAMSKQTSMLNSVVWIQLLFTLIMYFL